MVAKKAAAAKLIVVQATVKSSGPDSCRASCAGTLPRQAGPACLERIWARASNRHLQYNRRHVMFFVQNVASFYRAGPS